MLSMIDDLPLCVPGREMAASSNSVALEAPSPHAPGGPAASAEGFDCAEDLPAAGANWKAVVERIQLGEESGMEDLYRVFAKGIRYYLCRHLGKQELEDKIHDTFLIVVQAIRRGDLREPERLMGFVRTIVRRQVASYIDQVVHSRREEADLEVGVRIADLHGNPEQSAAVRQKVEFMRNVLGRLSDRDREILTRFYLDEQPQEQICAEMKLSDTQFRLLKSRAKARFGELGRKKLQRKPLLSIFLRTSCGLSH